MAKRIQHISALEILDSRGDPTLEVSIILDDGTEAKAQVPSGASTGTYEAFELRDNDPKRYGGKGVLKAVANVNTKINEQICGFEVTDQAGIDEAMIRLDGTENKQKLGANAILGVSLAVARAATVVEHMPLYRYIRSCAGFSDAQYTLPVPCINVINGGKHASSNLDIQEFWIIPSNVQQFKDRLRQGSEIFHSLGALLRENNMDTDLGNEGGYAPNFPNHAQVFEVLMQAIAKAGYTAGDDVVLGIDAGASVFFDAERSIYELSLEHQEYTSDEMQEFYFDLLHRYPILALEDPFAEEDWTTWQKFTARMKEKFPRTKLIGDDLFVTNTERFKKGIDLGAANTILIKPNQIGTLTETLACIMLAKKNKYATVISHRSGETDDTFIADLAVAVNSEYIKTGSTARGERTTKYNRLLEIEEELYG